MNQPQPPTQAHPKPVLGLLGAPGSGKSTVARAFADLGCGVIDADRLAHEALQSQAVRDQLAQWWGDDVLDDADRVDRSAVGKIVFADTSELRRLESLVHPLVHAGRAREREQHFADPGIVAVIEDCPLLLESGLDKDCDALVYVDCPYDVRLARLAKTRGWDETELKKREDMQTPLDIKRDAADYVISNGEEIAHIHEQAEHVLQSLRKI